MNQNVIIINWSVALCMTNGNSSKLPAYRQNTYNLPVESISHEKKRAERERIGRTKKGCTNMYVIRRKKNMELWKKDVDCAYSSRLKLSDRLFHTQIRHTLITFFHPLNYAVMPTGNV